MEFTSYQLNQVVPPERPHFTTASTNAENHCRIKLPAGVTCFYRLK